MTAAIPRVPEGLRDLMKGLTKEILREKPNNIYDFSLNYFETLLNKSDEYTVKKYEQPIRYENLYRVRDCNPVPVAIVFKIIPETLTELIKEFIKAVLRENPKNICEFGVDYFRSLQKTTVKNDDMRYNTYDDFIKNKEYFSLSPYAKCTCGRQFLSEVKADKAISNNPQQHLNKDIKDFSRETPAVNACLNHVTAIEKKSVENSQLDLNDEVYINAVCVIQRFYRNWVMAKQTKNNGLFEKSNEEHFKMSEQAAAVIIQRSLRKLFAKKFKQNLKPYPVIPILPNIPHNEENNDNISEAASYTSASTVRMSAESAAETMEMEIENSAYEPIVSDEKTVSQKVREVDEQQNEKAAEFEFDKQTEENSINSQKGSTEDMDGVGDVLNLNFLTQNIQSKNEAYNQPEHVDESLIDMKEDSKKPCIHPKNIETIERGDSSQRDFFVNMEKQILEISDPLENSGKVIDPCSESSQKLEKLNTPNKLILQDDNKESNIGIPNKQVLAHTEAEQATKDGNIHNIKKRHVEGPNKIILGDIYDEKNCLEKFESQIDDVEMLSYKNNDAYTNNSSSVEKLEEIKISNSEYLKTNQEVVEARDTLDAIKVQISKIGNTSTETTKTIKNGEHLDVILILSSDHDNEEEISHQVYQEVNVSDKNGSVEECYSYAGNLNELDEKISSQSEITTHPHKSKPRNEDFHKSESGFNINSMVSESLEKPLCQVFQEKEKHSEVYANTSVKDDLTEIRNQISEEYSDQKQNSIEASQPAQENLLQGVYKKASSIEKINSSSSDKHDSTEDLKTNQTQIFSESNEVISLDEFSHQILNTVVEAKQNGAVETETNADVITAIPVTKILQQVSEEEHKNWNANRAVSAESDVTEIIIDIQTSGKDNNPSKVSVKSGEQDVQKGFLHKVTEEDNGNVKINRLPMVKQDSTEVDQISETDLYHTEITAELNEDRPFEEPLDHVSKKSEENCRNDADVELDITITAEHCLTKINNLVQSFKEDSNPIQGNVESTPTTTQCKLLHDRNDALSTSKQGSSDQTSQQVPNNHENIVKLREETKLEELLQSVSQNAEEVESIENNTTEVKSINQYSELKPIQETFVESKEINPEEKLLHPSSFLLSEVHEKVDKLVNVEDNLTKINNFDRTSDSDSNHTKTTVESHQRATKEKFSNIVSNNDKPIVPARFDSTDITNVEQNSDQTLLSVKSSKSVSEVELLHNNSQEDDGKTDSRRTVSQDSKENQNTDKIDENRRIQIPYECNETKPLANQLHQNTQEAPCETEIFAIVTKVEPVHNVLQESNEEDNHENLNATTPGEHDQTDISNVNEISEINLNITQISVQINQITSQKDLPQTILLKDNDIARKRMICFNSEDPIKVKNSRQASINGSSQSDIIFESRETESQNGTDQISYKDQKKTESSLETNKANSIEKLSELVLIFEEGLRTVKDVQTDIRSTDQTEQTHEKYQNEIAGQSNRMMPQNELLHQVIQDKEETIVKTTFKDDLKKIHNNSANFEENKQSSKPYSTSSEIVQNSDMQSVATEISSTETIKIILQKYESNEQSLEKEDSLNQNDITIDKIISDKSNRLSKEEMEDGSTKISSIKKFNDPDSRQGKNNRSPNKTSGDNFKLGENVIMRNEIGFESILNEVQGTETSINDILVPVEKSHKLETHEEVSKEVFSKKIINLEYIIKQSTSLSDEKDADFITHNEKIFGASKEDLGTNGGYKDANSLKLWNHETDMNSQKTDTRETDSIPATSARMFKTTSTKEVDTTHDTSTSLPNTQTIGTKNPFKNNNQIDHSESSNSINLELSSNKESFSNSKSTSKLALVEEYEPQVPDMNIKMYHRSNDPSSMAHCLKISNENIHNPGEGVQTIDMNTKECSNCKDLNCENIKQDETKIKPRHENERTATYMYGVHTARQISSQTSKTLRKTSTSYNIPLLGNHTGSLESSKHTNQESASIKSNVNPEKKDDSELISVESPSNCEDTSKTMNTKNFSIANKTNFTTSENLELNLNLASKNNDVRNEIGIDTPTKLDVLDISKADDKVENTTVDGWNKCLNESNNNILPDLELGTKDLNTHHLQSTADDILQEDVDSEHNRTLSGVLKTIIELNESETNHKSESEKNTDEQTKTADDDDSQIKKHNMVNIFNEPYDPLEFGSASDNESEFTNSWTCSKETDENVFSDEFINEIVTESEPQHFNKSKIIKSVGSLQGVQGGIYEMNDNLLIEPINATSISKRNSNEVESQGENDVQKQIDVANSNVHVRTSKTKENENNYSAKDKATEIESFAISKSLQPNYGLDSDNISNAESDQVSTLKNCATGVETVTSPILNIGSVLYNEHSHDLELERSMENFGMCKSKPVFIEEKLSPKICNNSSKNSYPATETIQYVLHPTESQSILNETNRELTIATLAQKEIEPYITRSQISHSNEIILLAVIENSDEISKKEFYQNKVHFNTDNKDPSSVKDYDDCRDTDMTSISTNTDNKDRVETTSLLDKSAIIKQTAHKKYNLKKNIPLSSNQNIKTENFENKNDLSKFEDSNNSSKVQNNAAKVIQNLFRTYYAKKNMSYSLELPHEDNVEELAKSEAILPPYDNVMSLLDLNTSPEISHERSNDVKVGKTSLTIREFSECNLGNDKIKWFVGDEPIVRSFSDTSAPLNMVVDAGTLKQDVINASLVGVVSQHRNVNTPTYSTEPAISPSTNSIEAIKVDSTSSLLKPVSISFSINSKLKHSDETVSAEELDADKNLFHGRHEIPVTLADDGNIYVSVSKKNDGETQINLEETPIEKHSNQEVSSVKAMSPKSFKKCNEKGSTVTQTCEGESPPEEKVYYEANKGLTSLSNASSTEENNILSKEFGELRNHDETPLKEANLNSEAIRTEFEISIDALRLATDFLDSRTSDQTNMLNSDTHSLDLEREEPCIKKCLSLKDIENNFAFLETNNSGRIPLDKSNASEEDAVDSLEASTEKLRKTDEIIEKMQQKYVAESRVNSVDERMFVERNFEEPIIKSMKELQDTLSRPADTDEIVVLKPFQREDTRESSEQSDSVIFGSEQNSNNEEEINLVKASLRRLYTIPGDDANVLFKTVTIDKTIKYIEPLESETTGNSDSNSFCLDEDTSENIRQKMMAYSLSEADSDFLGAETRNDSESMDKSSISPDDFNIKTALGNFDGTSTETESTIVSAVTKIQAGARGFLTRRRLRRSSVGTKTSLPENKKASFGNAAIDESLERLIEEEAAKKIQAAYRKHYRQGKNLLNAKMGHADMTCCEESEEVACKEAEVNTFSSFERALAARRHTLQRGDAMRNDSAPDEENTVSPELDRISKSFSATTKEKNTIKKETSGAAAADNGKKSNNELKWIALRQNSMPVQIESEVFRVIPKHMRKRIKSAGGENKRRMRVLQD